MSDTIVIQTGGDTITVNPGGGAIGIADAGQRGVGVPAGGTTGQGLVKASNADYDTEWSDSAGGGGSSTFVGLTDTPGAFVADRIVTVNAAGDALEFPTASNARTLLGLGSAALAASGDFATASHTHTLSDVTDAGTAAAADTGDFDSAGTAAAAVASHAGTTTGVHGISAYGASLINDANAGAARTTLGLGSAAVADTGDFATAAQGALADTATQPGDLAAVATSGDYDDLINTPSGFSGSYDDLTDVPTEFPPESHNHTASEVTDFATAADARIAAADLADLNDVDITGTDTFDVLAWSGSGWENSDVRVFIASYLTGTAELTDLSDVTIAAPATGHVIRWNGAGWVNVQLSYDDLDDLPTLFDGAYSSLSGIPSTFAPSAHTLGSHSDVSLSLVTAGNFLRWSGSAWANTNIGSSDIPNLAASKITSGTFADARISQSSVTQHQAALSIATSQLTGSMPDARIVASNVTQHQASLAINGSQVTGKSGPGASWDGQGAALTTGNVVRSVATEAGVVLAVYGVADQSGSVDVIVRHYAAADTSFASPTSLGTLSISSAIVGTLGSLSQAVAVGDVLEFELDGAATSIERLTVRSRI